MLRHGPTFRYPTFDNGARHWQTFSGMIRPPNFEKFPCMSDPDVRALMDKAKPCRQCGGTNLMPVSDLDTPPVIAIMCNDCGEIEGDAASLRTAIANWNFRPTC